MVKYQSIVRVRIVIYQEWRNELFLHFCSYKRAKMVSVVEKQSDPQVQKS